jgi:hypothetical protein
MASALQSITSIQPPFNMIVLVTLIVMTASLVGGAIKQSRKFFCHKQELEFKRELLDRGMSADEIERVVRARAPGADSEA